MDCYWVVLLGEGGSTALGEKREAHNYDLQLLYFLSLTDLNSLRREKRQGKTPDNLRRKVKLKKPCAKNLCFVMLKPLYPLGRITPVETVPLPLHKTMWFQQVLSLLLHPGSQTWQPCGSSQEPMALTWERILVHCCSRDTGGLPMLVASWTLSSCSFWVAFPCSAWARATAAHQFERESVENRPPQSSWPAETELPVAANRQEC